MGGVAATGPPGGRGAVPVLPGPGCPWPGCVGAVGLSGPVDGQDPLSWRPEELDDDGSGPWMARSGCVLALACAVLVIVAVLFATWGVSVWLGW